MKNGSINNFLDTLRFGRPYVGYLVLVSLLNLLTIAADLGFLYLLKKLIDTGFATQNLSTLKWLALGALGILLLRSASGYVSGFLSNYVNGRMAADIQDLLYSKIQLLSMDFHTDVSTGDLLTLVFYHTHAMLQIITSISGIMIRELFRIPALIIFLFSLHSGLALFALLVFPPALLSLRLLRNLITKTTQNTHGVLSQLYETAEQTLSHAEVIKTFAREEEEAERFKDLNKEMVSRSIKAYQAAGMSGPATQLLKMAGVTFLVFMGTHEVAQGDLSVGGLTTFLASAYYFYGALSSFTNWYLSLLTGLVSADKILKVLKIQPAVLPPIKGVAPCPFEKEIILRDISLRYPSKEKEALKGINLRIAKGETIGLVGPSGSGKSSLIKILLRLYDPTRGTIMLDAHKLTDIDLKALRGLFGIAPQDPGIFQGSVETAITYGRPEASKEEIDEAVRMAGAHEFISNLPQGYQTMIGERAVKLSGGEKQRLALARALLRDPEILILDEALSSVDGSTEKAILQNISSNRRGRTNILISHRLMSIVHVDRIVVMDRGAIIEEGNHQELLAAPTKYQKWFFVQQSEP